MKNKISQIKKGFTMIEMLMVLAIFTILTSVVMYNYAEFNSKTVMSNVAYEIALSVRQAQVYSLGVRGQVGASSFDNRYGVYFNKDANAGKDFVFFFDEKPNIGEPDGWCGSADIAEPNCLSCIQGEECLEKVTLPRDMYVGRICAGENINPIDLSTGQCSGIGSQSYDEMSVTFDRPNPDAKLKSSKVGGELNNKNVGIVVKNKFGNQRAVIIRSTGQISVVLVGDSV